jgi:hypothetical protein
MPHEDGEEGDASERRPSITLLYVRPGCDGLTELDRRVGAIAERYSQWVELIVVRPEELIATPDLERVAGSGSPALLLLRRGEVVGEAMGALLPTRELDQVVRRAVEWPAPM